MAFSKKSFGQTTALLATIIASGVNAAQTQSSQKKLRQRRDPIVEFYVGTKRIELGLNRVLIEKTSADGQKLLVGSFEGNPNQLVFSVNAREELHPTETSTGIAERPRPIHYFETHTVGTNVWLYNRSGPCKWVDCVFVGYEYMAKSGKKLKLEYPNQDHVLESGTNCRIKLFPNCEVPKKRRRLVGSLECPLELSVHLCVFASMFKVERQETMEVSVSSSKTIKDTIKQLHDQFAANKSVDSSDEVVELDCFESNVTISDTAGTRVTLGKLWHRETWETYCSNFPGKIDGAIIKLEVDLAQTLKDEVGPIAKSILDGAPNRR